MAITETTGTETKVYTDSQATDEAVLLLIRKLGRLHPEAYADVIRKLPEGARFALTLAENRADMVRDGDKLNGTKHRYMTDEERYGDLDEE
jgi:hypothetical protein